MADINIKLTVIDKNKAVGSLKSVNKTVGSLEKSLNDSRKSASSLGTTLGGIGTAIGAAAAAASAFAGAFILKRSVDEAVRLENALTGLRSVARNTGNDVDNISKIAQELASDGLIPLSQVSASLKNLLATGLDAPVAVKTFKALREAASFNRQGQLELGEAIEGATQGIKNQISNLIDNAGITKNISVLQKEYAASLNTTIGRLTESQKVQAIANGIIKEAAVFQGDYNKVLGTFQGATSEASGRFTFFLAEIGKLITQNPLVIRAVKGIASVLQNLTQSVNSSRFQFAAFTERVANSLSFLIENFDSIKNAAIAGIAGASVLAFKTFAVSVSAAVGAVAAKLAILIPAITGVNGAILLTVASAKIAAATLTLGLSVAVGGLVFKFLELKKEVGSTANVFKFLSLQAKIVFKQIQIDINEFIGSTKEVGDAIGKNIVGGLNKVKTFFGGDPIEFTSLERSAKETQNVTLKLSGEIVNLRKELDNLGESTKPTVKVASDLDRELEKLTTNARLLGKETTKTSDDVAKSVTSIRKTTSPEFKKLQDELTKSLTPDREKLNIELNERLSLVNKELKQTAQANVTSIGDFRQLQEVKTKIVADFNRKVNVLDSKQRKQRLEDAKRESEELDRIEQERLRARQDFVRKASTPIESFLSGDSLEGAAGVANALTKGAQGAKDLLVEGSALAVDAFAPGLGQALKPVLGLFAEGPEAVESALKDFSKSLPVILENVLLSIPTVITVLAEEAPRIIDSLVEKLPTVINSLAEKMPEVATALAGATPLIATQFSTALIANSPQIVQAVVFGIARALPGALVGPFKKIGDLFKLDIGSAGKKFLSSILEGGSKFISKIIEGAKNVFNIFGSGGSNVFSLLTGGGNNVFGSLTGGGNILRSLLEGAGLGFITKIETAGIEFAKRLAESLGLGGLLGGGGGGSGGILGGLFGGVGGSIGGAIGDVFGFAEGGVVPSGFPGDTFPAKLSSGEFVVNNALTPRLESFLDRQDQGTNTQDDGIDREILFRILEALERPQTATAQVEFNQDTLADVILTLNRGNRRLT